MSTLTNEPKDSLLECADLLQQLDALLGAYEPLTGDEVRRRTRLSRRKEAAVPEIADVCRTHGLTGAASASVEDMLASHREARVLREQLEALDLVRARLDARRLGVEADLARYVTFFYELARSAARFDEAIRDRLEAVTAFFQTAKGRGRTEWPRRTPG